jgi:ankyrin repeat protein
VGWTPLHAAASNGKVAVVNFLIDREADLNPVRASLSLSHFWSLRADPHLSSCFLLSSYRLSQKDKVRSLIGWLDGCKHHVKLTIGRSLSVIDVNGRV